MCELNLMDNNTVALLLPFTVVSWIDELLKWSAPEHEDWRSLCSLGSDCVQTTVTFACGDPIFNESVAFVYRWRIIAMMIFAIDAIELEILFETFLWMGRFVWMAYIFARVQIIVSS